MSSAPLEPLNPEQPQKNQTSSGNFATDMLKLVSGTAFAQIVAILATPFITRLFSPEAYGINAAFVSIISIVQVFLMLRYDQAIVLPQSDADAANLVGASTLIGVAISFLTGLVIWLFGGWLFGIFNMEGVDSYTWVLIPTLLTSVFYSTFSLWNTRKRRFGVLASSQVINALGTTALRIGAGASGLNGAPSLMITNWLGSLLALVYLGWDTLRGASRIFRDSIRWDAMIAQVKRYSDQPRYGTGAMLLNSISWQLPVFVLAAFFSPAAAGQYALGQRVIRTPMSVVGNSISQVFYTRAASARHEGTLTALTRSVYRRLVLFGLAPSLYLMVAASDLFQIAFGKEWQVAGQFVQILSLWSFVWFISSPISQLQMVLGKQRYFLVWNIINFATRFVSLWYGSIRGDVYLAMALFGLSGVIMYGWLAIYLMNAAGISTLSIFQDLASNLTLYIPVIAIAWITRGLDISPLIRLTSVTILFGVMFLFSVRNEPMLVKVRTKLAFNAPPPG